MDISKERLMELIRQVVEEVSQEEDGFHKEVDLSGVIRVETSTVKCERMDTGNPNDYVATRDILTLQESPRIGCGVLELDHTSFPWTLGYDECDYVIDGTLDILIDGRCVRGQKGDILHIPAGSSIQFSTPDHCRAAYFTYPANWAENGG